LSACPAPSTPAPFPLSLHDALPISRRRLNSAIHSSRVTPGNRRQSSPASATDGITLIFGGLPTPERTHVTAIVDCWIAFVNSLRSEEHTSELQSPDHLVCRLLLEKK